MSQRYYPDQRAPARRVPWDDVRRLAAEGRTARQIVDALGLACEGGTLRYQASRRGIVIRAATRAERSAARESFYQVWTPQSLATLATMWEAGETARAIGQAIGCTHRSVMEKVARMGLSRRGADPTPEAAETFARRAAVLPLPPVPHAILPAIAALLEAA